MAFQSAELSAKEPRTLKQEKWTRKKTPEAESMSDLVGEEY